MQDRFRHRQKVPAQKSRVESTKPPLIQRVTQDMLQRAMHAPGTLTPTDIMALQGTVGNAAVQRILANPSGQMPSSLSSAPLPVVQTKLMVGATGDVYEREADQVARQVIGRLHAQKPAAPLSTAGPSSVQRETDEGDTSSMGPEGGAVTSDVENSIRSTRSGGQPLPAQTLSAMEQAFGANFSGVRIHHSQQADSLNRAIDARAFTSGQDIYFRQGEFNPNNRQGQGLLAHELTHVIQQNSGQLQRAASGEGSQSQMLTPEERIPTAQQSAASTYALGQTPQVVQRAEPGRIHRCGNKKKRRGGGNKVTKTKGTKNNGSKNNTPLDDYVTAYRKARLYHGTPNEYVSSIEKEGLQTKYGGTGLNGAPNRKNRVFLGWDSVTSEGYGKDEGLGRVFLGPDRTKAEMNSNDFNSNIKAIPEERKGEMFRDPENPSAFFTERDIGPEHVWFGDNQKLLDNPEKAQFILGTIRQHMENPPGSMQELIELHQEAMDKKRISMRPGDLKDLTKHILQWQ
jgi:hypothetical protein